MARGQPPLAPLRSAQFSSVQHISLSSKPGGNKLKIQGQRSRAAVVSIVAAMRFAFPLPRGGHAVVSGLRRYLQNKSNGGLTWWYWIRDVFLGGARTLVGGPAPNHRRTCFGGDPQHLQPGRCWNPIAEHISNSDCKIGGTGRRRGSSQGKLGLYI